MKQFFLITVSAALITGSAFAAMAESEGKGKMQGHHGKGAMLAEMDSNSDGSVTKDEFIAHAAKKFAAMDTNNDGKLTEEEMRKHHEAEKAKHEARQKEREAEEDKRFSEMDTDGDGKLSKEEMQKHKESMKGKHDDSPSD